LGVDSPLSGVMSVSSMMPTMVTIIHLIMRVGSRAKVACHHTLSIHAMANMIEMVVNLLVS